MTLTIALINFLICGLRFLFTVKDGRLIAIVWFLIAYFAFSFIFVVTQGAFDRYKEFSGINLKITEATITKVAIYMLAFNVLFLAVEWLAWKVVGIHRQQQIWVLPKRHATLRNLNLAFLGILILGTVLYAISTIGHGYRDYVEYRGSSWGLVFLWAGSPVIVICALQKKYMYALLATIPFLIFSIKLNIRSFFLLSLIPLTTVYFFQLASIGK